MTTTDVAVVAIAIVLYAAVSRRTLGWPVTMPMVFVILGLLAAVSGVVDLDLDTGAIALLTEGTLALVLFSDASRIDVRALRRDGGLPARLLGLGLPLTVALGAGVVLLLLPEVSVVEAALLAAVLAPTDAALGQAVVEDESVPLRIRQALNVESGLNDGLALPLVLAFVAVAAGQAATAGEWVGFAAQALGLGAAVGAGVGVAGAGLLLLAQRHGWLGGVYAQLGTLALAVLALTAATAAGGNGFVSAFVAGLVYGALSHGSRGHGGAGQQPAASATWGEYVEDTGQLLAAVSFFVFGNVLVVDYAGALDWRIALCVVLTLTVGRMLPVAVALVGARVRPLTVAFLGWFGPRGLASVLFGLLLLEERLPASEALFAVIAWTVLASVVLHGATAAAGARRYGAWFAEVSARQPGMPESWAVPTFRTGRGRPR